MPASPTVLHYVGYNDDRGGIMAVIWALASTHAFPCTLGVNTGFVSGREPALPVLELPPFEGEVINLHALWRARAAARAVREWLRADPARVFHGHSRAGLLVALWLQWWGERKVVVSVHCYGRQRWFYRWSARRFGDRLFWLSPAMRRYYDLADSSDDWAQCMPECVAMKAGPAKEVTRGGVLRLAGVGSLTPWKGWHHVIEALALLPAEVRARIQFRHIGGAAASREGERYAASLFARTKDAGLSDSVLWLGQQPSSASLLAESDCLIVASNNEPFSLAMLEALHAGVPVVAADSGGATDLVAPPKNGLLFRTGSAQDLARVLRSLVETDLLTRLQVGHQGLERFSADVVALQWAAVYARVLGQF